MKFSRAFVGVAFVAASTLVALAAPQQQPAPSPAPGSPGSQDAAPVFKSAVELVNLSVTVTDKNGRNVADLKKEDFRIFEDKKPQEIMSFRSLKDPSGAEPIGLGLVLDASGSMTPDKLAAMRTSVESMMSDRLKKDDEVYLVEFSTDARLTHPWTTDKKAVVNTVRRIKTKNGTAIYDGIMAALPISKTGKHKKQVMLVITDGEDTNSTALRSQVAQAARASEVIVYALVLDGEEALGQRSDSKIRQGAAELAQVTDATGGRTVYVQGFQAMEDAIMQLGKEFTQQYEIGFVRGSADGQLHELVVGVARQNVIVRHRRVYMAGSTGTDASNASK